METSSYKEKADEKITIPHQTKAHLASKQAAPFLKALADTVNLSETTTDELQLMHAACVEKLDSLISQIKNLSDYERIRDEYIQNEIKLCQLGLLAPAFRLNPNKLPRVPNTKYEHTHELILQDRIMIDVIWLRLRKEPIVVTRTEHKWRPMFKSDNSIPIELLQEFATTPIKGEVRASEILSLTPLQQLQMRVLKSATIRERINLVEKSKRDASGIWTPCVMELARKGINRWAEKDRRIQPEREKYLAIILANALLTTSAPTWSEVAKLTGLILGKPPLHPKTVADLYAKAQPHLLNN